MESGFKDYYAILGVDRGADAAAIKRAYRELARKHHPDRAQGADKAAAEERIKEINEAYEVLKDPAKRRRYDQLGAAWQDGAATAGGFGRYASGRPGAGGSGGRGMRFGGTGFSDFFEQFFGSGDGSAFEEGFGPFGGSGERRPRGGQDAEADLMVSLEEAATGASREISVRSVDPLTGYEENVPLRVRIPAGIREGQRLRVAGRGGRAENGGAPGDLYLRVRLAPHPDFRVEGGHLYHELELMPWDVVLGTKVTVPTLTGSVRITIPPGARAGQTLRVRGRGLPATKKAPAGDLLVELVVQTPATVTPEARALWQQLAENAPASKAK